MIQISRVRRSKNEARRTYNRLSSFYDLLSGSSEAALIQLGLHMLDVQVGESILEIGPGTGTTLVELASRVGTPGSVVGIDLSPGMLHRTQARVNQAGAYRIVLLVEGDGCLLPYPCGIFNAIFIAFTLELFDTPEIPVVLAECRRVLKPGGRLGVVAMQKNDHPNWIVRLYEWFHKAFPSVVDCRPVDARTLIASAGFKVEINQVKSMWGLPVELVAASKS
jgi:demethylmenaquinone methyltransferase/2-methoxy-6-polyprenyl-1,4-benzoquinol methylase